VYGNFCSRFRFKPAETSAAAVLPVRLRTYALYRWDVRIGYVLVPRKFESLQAELDSTLAPFRRGGEDDFPREKLAFDDVTDDWKNCIEARSGTTAAVVSPGREATWARAYIICAAKPWRASESLPARTL